MVSYPNSELCTTLSNIRNRCKSTSVNSSQVFGLLWISKFSITSMRLTDSTQAKQKLEFNVFFCYINEVLLSMSHDFSTFSALIKNWRSIRCNEKSKSPSYITRNQLSALSN